MLSLQVVSVDMAVVASGMGTRYKERFYQCRLLHIGSVDRGRVEMSFIQ